jgi:hypothetical protein
MTLVPVLQFHPAPTSGVCKHGKENDNEDEEEKEQPHNWSCVQGMSIILQNLLPYLASHMSTLSRTLVF